MGPLLFCVCGNNLNIEYEILLNIRKEMLKDIKLEELYLLNQNELLKNQVYELFEYSELNLCCRTELMTYQDITDKVY